MSDERRTLALRIAAACGVAGALAVGVYLLLGETKTDNGLVSVSFLLILPAAVSAFVAYLADPRGTAGLRRYLLVPVWQIVAAIVVGAVVLGEGVVCILMLAPLWLISGLIGAGLTYRFRRRLAARRELERIFCVGALALPLLAMQVEPYLPPPPIDTATVTRELVVEASAERIWPLLRGVPDVRADEGRWNLSQDVIGIPRPEGAVLVGDGIGAVRSARWQHGIRFREVIDGWRPGQAIGWRFVFDPRDDWGYTDRHLLPESAYLAVTHGGYRLASAGLGRTRVTLWTRYRMRTPVNAYSRLWGEFFLGDIENNLLAMVKGRAEAPVHAPRPG